MAANQLSLKNTTILWVGTFKMLSSVTQLRKWLIGMRKLIKNFNSLKNMHLLFFRINNFRPTSSKLFKKKIGKDFKLFKREHKIKLMNASILVNMYHAKMLDIIMIFLNF
jgi:hypothetical protein